MKSVILPQGHDPLGVLAFLVGISIIPIVLWMHMKLEDRKADKLWEEYKKSRKPFIIEREGRHFESTDGLLWRETTNAPTP